MGRMLHLLLLAGVAAMVMFVNLGAPSLWDRDEPRNASCAREMMERGDWVVPTFNDDLRVLKPALKYWQMIAAYRMFGVNEFAARFFSAVSALLAAWVTYLLAARLFGPRAGLLSGVVLLTCLLFAMAGHMAKIDATLTLASALALLAYASFAFTPGDGLTDPIPRWWAWALVYAALGLALLAKGLPGVVPAAVIGMFLLIVRLPASEAVGWWQRALDVVRPFAPLHFLRVFLAMRPLMGLLIVLAVAGPWYVLVGLRTDGEFLRGFFLTHHFGRAMEPMEGHGGPFLAYYLGTIAAGLFPWSVFLLPLAVWLVARLREAGPRRDACLFLSCYVGVYVVLFSCARTKLPSYITPCFPGVAVLVGALLDEAADGVSGWLGAWMKAGLGLLALAGVAVIVASFFIGQLIAGAEVLCVLGVVLALAGVAAFVLMHKGRALASVAAACVGLTVFTAGAFGVLLPRVGSVRTHDEVCRAILRRCPEARFGTHADIDPSWVFYATRPIVPVVVDGKPPPAAKAWTATPVPLAEFAAGEGRYLIAKEEEWGWLQKLLPSDARVVAEAPVFLRKRRWIVIELPSPQAARVRAGG